MEHFAQSVLQWLRENLDPEIQLTDLETPPQAEWGQFAYPCYATAKKQKKAPQLIAAEKAVKACPFELSAKGPYLNFRIPAALLIDTIPTQFESHPQKPGEAPWIIEYSSPNIAKPLNIYHLRPTALGAALARIARFRGRNILTFNHLGDWGKQYGLLITAFKRYSIDPFQTESIQVLVDAYVRINQELAHDPSIEESAKAHFQLLESGDEATRRIWARCVELSLQDFQSLYERLKVSFDYIRGESFYEPLLRPLLEKLKQTGVLKKSEGAWIVEVTDEKETPLPPCLLEKSDGTTLYATRDLAAAIHRWEHFKFGQMSYIVGGEQKLHFQQLFSVLRQLDLPWASNLEHIPTGLYRSKDAKMSTRKGNYVTLQSVLEEAEARVRVLTIERGRDLSEGDIKIIATGAVVFADLSVDPAKDVQFDLERVLDFEGETGPYIQYAHTRALSILRKADIEPQKGVLDEKEAYNLYTLLSRLGMVLERVMEYRKPSLLTQWLIDLAKGLHVYYRAHPILQGEPELKAKRLWLIQQTQQGLAQGLHFLGIETPSEM